MVELNYTGHPLFDVWFATIAMFADRVYASKPIEEDLIKTATFIYEH